MVNNTGGLMILADSFTTSIFKSSFHRLFDTDMNGDLNMGFNATMEIQVK